MSAILPFIIALGVGAAISLALAGLTIRLKPPTWRSFAALQLGSALWSIGHAVELSSPELAGKVMAVNFVFVGVSVGTLSLLYFTIIHTGGASWLTARRAILLAIIPIGWLPIIWSNPAHNLFFADFRVGANGPFPYTVVVWGPAAIPYLIYNFGVSFGSLVIRVRSLIRSPQLYRGQITALLIAAFVPVIASLVHVTYLSRIWYADIGPLSFNVSGLAYAFAVLRGRLFNVVPIARDMVIESMADAMIILDANNLIIDMNPAAEQLLGQRAGAVIGESSEIVLAGRPDLIERYRDITEIRDEIELSPGGVRRIFELRISPIYNRWMALTGRLIGLRDITESRIMQKRLQAQLRETMVLNRVLATVNSTLDLDEMLSAVCAELAQAIQLPRAAIALLDEGPQSLRIQAEFTASEQDSALGEVIPTGDNEVDRELLQAHRPLAVNDIASDPRRDDLMRYARGGAASALIVPLMVRDEALGALMVVASNVHEFSPEEVALAERVAAAASQAVQNAHLYVALQDELAERKRAQAELQIAKEYAEAANRAKSAFLANMSHELRTPLNSIIGYTELLMQGMYGPITDKQDTRLDAVRRNGSHLLTLINDVLDLSKIEAGRMELRSEPVMIGMVLENCLTAIEPQARRRGLTVERDLPQDLPLARGDAARMTQVFTNLLSNAVKFTHEGSVMVSASVVKPGEKDGYPFVNIVEPTILIAVRDTGMGIAEKDHEMIFDEFRQVDSSSTREFEGTGLGLSITKRLVLLMDGHIWLESTPGQGTTFYVTLPLAGQTES